MGQHTLQSMRMVARWISRQSERGASLVEYALLVALIAVVMAGAVALLGEGTKGSLDRSNTSITDAIQAGDTP